MDFFKDPHEPKGKKIPFKDPIGPKKREVSKEFKAPQKEVTTTGRYNSCGDSYGVGHRVPVGKMKASGISSGPIPMSSSCHNPDEIL